MAKRSKPSAGRAPRRTESVPGPSKGFEAYLLARELVRRMQRPAGDEAVEARTASAARGRPH